MKLMTGLALLLLIGVAPAQDRDVRTPRGRCCSGGVAKPWKSYNQGVRWAPSMEEAFATAAKERRLLLVFHTVGDLDKEGC